MGTTGNWKPSPANSQWTDAGNWVQGVVPDGVAELGATTVSTVTFSSSPPATIGTIDFLIGAPSYTLYFGVDAATPALTISGGVVNTSGVKQYLTVAANPNANELPQLQFTGTALAGDSTIQYYAGPTSLQAGYAGGIITFSDSASAGTASFDIRTGAVKPPGDGPVGAEVRFTDSSTASHATFTVYGTLGSDGDTFGNAVFHGNATADHATFVNVGGTVDGGDGGNTQFYESTTAANGTYCNHGGTVSGANGGDVAFDGQATAAYGRFYNQAAPASGAYGGVTSFNNNPNSVGSSDKTQADVGANAGYGLFANYGATGTQQGGGGHTELTAKYASPSAGFGTFHNYGSERSSSSCAGHTYLAIQAGSPYFPTGGNASFYNHAAPVAGGVGGYTELAVWTDEDDDRAPHEHVLTTGPTLGSATVYNLGATVSGAEGGYLSLKSGSSAGSATLYGYSGSNGGSGGRIGFYDDADGATANVVLYAGALLDLAYHTGPLTLASLAVDGGTVSSQLGSSTTTVALSGSLTLGTQGLKLSLSQGTGFAFGTTYTVLTAPDLSGISASQLSANSLGGSAPQLSVVGNAIQVLYPQPIGT